MNFLRFEYFLNRTISLLTVLPDRHDAIACISSASQFNILEAIKVKRLVVLHKTYRPFSFMLAPNSIALMLSKKSFLRQHENNGTIIYQLT